MIYFISDLHFGHNGILSFCKKTRKGNTIGEHDEWLLASINTVVGSQDELFVLGDFSFITDHQVVRKLFSRINGIKHLIVGNHDKQAVKDLPWESISWYKELNFNKKKYILSHYPFVLGQWNGAHKGSVHLFGHVHGVPQYTEACRALDVGVDSVGPIPLSINEIDYRMEKLPIVKKHGQRV